MNNHLIYQVLANKASEAEKKEVVDWIAGNDANKAEFDDIKLLLESGSSTIEPDTSDGAGLQKIQARFLAKEKQFRQKKTMLIIGSFVLVALVSMLYFLLNTSNDSRVFVFNNARLENVVNALEAAYDIGIKVEKPTALNCTLTGTFFEVENSIDLVKSVSAALGLEYELLSDGQYILKGPGCTLSRGTNLGHN
jgi:ferric-dicitrate binding protein FerR (iron transport regulator)